MRKFLRDDHGATAVEYALILALIVIVCVAAFTTLGNSTSGSWANMTGKAGAVM